MGNCGTSAKTPFVLTPTGSCQIAALGGAGRRVVRTPRAPPDDAARSRLLGSKGRPGWRPPSGIPELPLLH